MIAVVRGFRPRVPGRLVAAVLVVAVIVLLFLTGGLSAARWEPFRDPTTYRFLGEGLLTTLGMASVALVASLLLGFPIGVARSALRGPVGWLVSGYVELVRATPILAILFIVFLGVPRLGLNLPVLWAVIVGLTIYNSAVLGEIVRAGIASIPRGEVEAARSLGLDFRLTMLHVVLPQVISRMAPALVSQLITLVKDTSLAFILGGQELVGFGRSFFTFYGNPLETYIVIALLFFAVNYPLSRFPRRLQHTRPRQPLVIGAGEDVAAATAPA